MLRGKRFAKKTKRGAVIHVNREHYLRDDIWCGVAECTSCKNDRVRIHVAALRFGAFFSTDKSEPRACSRLPLNPPFFPSHPSANHKGVLSTSTTILCPDTNVALHQMDFLEHPKITNVVLLSVVLEEVKHRSKTTYDRLRACVENPDKHFYVFTNEHRRGLYVEQAQGESVNDRNDRAIRVAAQWYAGHIAQLNPAAAPATPATNGQKGKGKGTPVDAAAAAAAAGAAGVVRRTKHT